MAPTSALSPSRPAERWKRSNWPSPLAPQRRSFLLRPLLFAAILLVPACAASRGQRYLDFTTPTPLPARECLVLGFLGGRDSWNDDKKGVRRLVLKLRQRELPAVHVESVENKKRGLALELIRKSVDRDRNGRLDEGERASACIILFGQSFGGAAVVKLARELQALGVPVRRTIQIDSVGIGDEVIPSNVAAAANLYQDNGFLIHGETRIRSEDPEKTQILGNFRFDYSDREIDLSGVPWHKKIGRVAHAKMDRDPEVWSRVEELILEAIPFSQGPVNF